VLIGTRWNVSSFEDIMQASTKADKRKQQQLYRYVEEENAIA